LSSQLLGQFAVSKVFKDNTLPVNSMDFFHTGELLVTASDDESIHLYDCVTGKQTKVLFSKKYGIDLVRFTRDKNSILSASKNDWDHTIRYMSVRSNTYIRYFKGHRDRVVSLALSPDSDLFLSGAMDDSVRLWDLRSNACQGLMRRHGRPAVQFAPQGLVFAVATGNNEIKMYDVRNFDKGPFGSFLVGNPNIPLEWIDLKFSPDGANLLASANGAAFLVDSYYGALLTTFSGFSQGRIERYEASMTPDGASVLCGGDDGRVHIFDSKTGAPVATLGLHDGPIGAVRFNPAFAMFASACKTLAFWLPPAAE